VVAFTAMLHVPTLAPFSNNVRRYEPPLTFTPAANANVAVVNVPADVNGVVVHVACVWLTQLLDSET
jgi:hypothetical protein